VGRRDSEQITRLSKFLSFVLRHEPQAIGLCLDANGWARIDELLERCRAHGKPLSRELLDTIVEGRTLGEDDAEAKLACEESPKGAADALWRH
jgi:RNA:NAD 2'-phosphotransferase (TPT1/KptA family)